MKPRLPVVLWAVCLAVVSSAGAADFTVSNTNNAGAGSLRQAITDANATPGKDRVVFAIPGQGLLAIRLTAPLPILSDPVELDAYTQPGSSPNTMVERDNAVRRIELDGIVSGGDGLVINTSESVVRGFAIRRFNIAVALQGGSNVVAGNHLGTDDAPDVYTTTNVVRGNNRGVWIGGVSNSCCNTIGGLRLQDRNVIAGNRFNAIILGETPSPPVAETRIFGNFLGVDSSGRRPSGNNGSSTISVRTVRSLIVGGPEPEARNIISASPQSACITIYEPLERAEIINNYFGVAADGHTPMPSPSTGISILAIASGNEDLNIHLNCRIEDNFFANLRSVAVSIVESYPFPLGVPLQSADRITISRNKMYANVSNGGTNSSIYFGEFAGPNDFLDLDVGANNRQNYPEIASATFIGDSFIVSGFLHSAPLADYRLEFFGNSVPHSSGFGEGEVFLGDLEVSTDANGNADFQMVFPASIQLHSHLSATATAADGSTSMFARTLQARSFVEPLFHSTPASMTVFPGTNITLTADVSGAGPMTFQWRRDGVVLPGATNLSLTLSNVVWNDRGTFVLEALNDFGRAETLPATLQVIAVPTVLNQPTNALVSVGTNHTFTVQVGGMTPLYYQWRRDGIALAGATNSSLTLSNIDWPQRGSYTVIASNAFGVAESAPATLTVRVRPIIIQQPLSQMVASGSVAYLSVAISNSATVPLTYMLRVNNSLAATVISTNYVAVFPIGPVRTNAGYNIHVTNIFSSAGLLSARATLTVAPDTDGDGLPDAFEDAYGLNRLDMSDAALDADGDGVTNIDEYRAGSDPADAENQLRISILDAAEQGNVIEFTARSNRVYRVQYQDSFTEGNWRTLVDVPARETNRVERWPDPAPMTPRFYRLQTPPVAGAVTASRLVPVGGATNSLPGPRRLVSVASVGASLCARSSIG